ncbi:hypothetical protein A946_01340 [Methylacidiphilum kamchatkense Kam1]|uniref:Glycosyltransferase family 28 N-terminal domain-containing protein n=1 Tax=Methylacidiphilum kamchatkense Kam1 TaxID=1202785 RepID=A0ABR4ZZ59_9BACT|nr:glycosyltransferase [Methylacidiphilum kamchatkense]KIE59374.1 hypothetical protein A946_01340 [Methylacidiphilum kamchatkense Kam1]
MKPFHILIPCGGTGGHLFPGIAVAEKLIEKGHHPLLILSDKPVDREAIKNKKILLGTHSLWQDGQGCFQVKLSLFL